MAVRRPITRRELLRRGGGLALALGVGGGSQLLEACGSSQSSPGATARSDQEMRKCISLGGPGPLRSDGDPDDYRLWGNREYFEKSNTRWVKLWVSWLDLQKELRSAPESMEQSWRQLNRAPGGGAWLRRLDAQARAANDDGRGVIVTLFHANPSWAGGASGHDPVSREKPAEQRTPLDLSPDGPWAWFIGHLCARYRKGAKRNPSGPQVRGAEVTGGNPDGAVIDALEICNEPNLLFWPQEGIERAAAEMMRTAAEVSQRLRGPTILGPGTSDFPDRSHRNERGLIATNWRTFTRGVLAELRDFEPQVPVYWSHHNFQDVKYQDIPSRAEEVLDLLEGAQWINHSQPLWLTEGGYDLRPNENVASTRRHQANLIEANYRRMAALGRIHLWTQHTISDKPGNDFKSGLRDDFVPGKGPGPPRPAWHTWMELPAARHI